MPNNTTTTTTTTTNQHTKSKGNEDSLSISSTASVATTVGSDKGTRRGSACFDPRPSKLILQHCDDAIRPDGDVWIECSYKNRTGHAVSYFRSIKTDKCQLLEPPTGASLVLYADEIATRPDLLKFLPAPIPTHKLKDIALSLPSKQFEADIQKKRRNKCWVRGHSY